jgi:hypothetical protein
MDNLEQLRSRSRTRSRTTTRYENAFHRLPSEGTTYRDVVPEYHPSRRNMFQEATERNQNNQSMMRENLDQEEMYKHLFQILTTAIQIIGDNDLQNDNNKRDDGSLVQGGGDATKERGDSTREGGTNIS